VTQQARFFQAAESERRCRAFRCEIVVGALLFFGLAPHYLLHSNSDYNTAWLLTCAVVAGIYACIDKVCERRGTPLLPM
jgi:hypothetical protein